MRKFIIHNNKGTLFIREVECELISPMEDPSILWELKEGEYKARILQPTTFYEKHKVLVDEKGKALLVPPIWYSHAFYDDVEDAKLHVRRMITEEFERNLRKNAVSYTSDELEDKVRSVVIMPVI